MLRDAGHWRLRSTRQPRSVGQLDRIHDHRAAWRIVSDDDGDGADRAHVDADELAQRNPQRRHRIQQGVRDLVVIVEVALMVQLLL